MYQLHVFVGSHMDELRFERETAIEVIRELNLLPGLFELLPAVSESPKRACIELVRDCDLMVLILGCRFSAPTLAEYHEAIARHKPIVIMVRWSNEERDDAVKDLLVDLQGRFVYKEYGTLSQFRNELKQALISEMGRALHPPLYTLTREEMYDLGADIIETSQRRLAVVQRTPSLFFGARPYHMPDEQKWGYEQRLLNSLERWVESALEDPARTLVYAYSPRTANNTSTNRMTLASRQSCRSAVPAFANTKR